MTSSPSPLSRRAFLGGAAALAASSAVPARADSPAAPRPDSKFGGVQIGVITYSFRSLPGGAENTLKYVLQCGIDSIELMGNTAEQFAGAPPSGKGGRQGRGEGPSGMAARRLDGALPEATPDVR